MVLQYRNMRTPHVSLENAEAVNEYFSQVQPNPALMRAFHFVMGQFIRGDVVFDEDAEEAIHKDLSEGRQIFLAHNHQNFYDPLVIASMMQKEKVFHPMITRTVIPGAAPFFNNRWYGWVVRNSGAIPVFRKSDDDDLTQQSVVRRAANDSQVMIMQAHMNRGMHGAIYPEGTRGRDKKDRHPTKLMSIHAGIGRIACGLDDPRNVRIVSVGTTYGANNEDLRHPTSFVARPFRIAGTPVEVVKTTKESLQYAVDSASDLFS